MIKASSNKLSIGKQMLYRLVMLGTDYAPGRIELEHGSVSPTTGIEFTLGYRTADIAGNDVTLHARLLDEGEPRYKAKPIVWLEIDSKERVLPHHEIKRAASKIGDIIEFKTLPFAASSHNPASYVFVKLAPHPSDRIGVTEEIDRSESALREVLLELVPWARAKFKQDDRPRASKPYGGYKFLKSYSAQHEGEFHPDVTVTLMRVKDDWVNVEGFEDAIAVEVRAKSFLAMMNVRDVATTSHPTRQLKSLLSNLKFSRVESFGSAGITFNALLRVRKKLAEVNNTVRTSFKSFLTEAKKKKTQDIDVVDVGAAIDEHRELSKKLAVAAALAKKMGERVKELESLLLPVVKETEAQQLTIGQAIMKFQARNTTSVSYKSAFEKALEMVNEEQRKVLKTFLESVTSRDVKEYVEVVDTEVAALLDKVKAAEKSGNEAELERLMGEVLRLPRSIKEGRFTDHVVKAFGWMHLSELFHKLRDKFKGMRGTIDWLQHIADNPSKFGG